LTTSADSTLNQKHPTTLEFQDSGVTSTKAIRLSDITIKDKYQSLIRALTPAEHTRLKDPISKYDVRVPIDTNEKFQILDGHHRAQVSIEFGFEYIPARIHNFSGDYDAEKRFIHDLNVVHRHLSEFEIISNSYTNAITEGAEERKLANLKAGTENKSPTDTGIAFLQSQGFLSEYAEILAQKASRLGANMRIVNDFDIAGVKMGLQFSVNAVRHGMDLQVVSDLGMKYKELEESGLTVNNEPTTHWFNLNKLLSNGGLNTYYREYLTTDTNTTFESPKSQKRYRPTGAIACNILRENSNKWFCVDYLADQTSKIYPCHVCNWQYSASSLCFICKQSHEEGF